MTIAANTVRFGELLTGAGFVSEDDMTDAVQIATDTRQLTGRVLVMSGYVTQEQLQAALAAQELIRNGKLDVSTALQTLKYARLKGVPFDEALRAIRVCRMQ